MQALFFAFGRAPIQKGKKISKKWLHFFRRSGKIVTCTGRTREFDKAARNKAAKSALKTQIKKFDAVVAEGNRSEADVVYKATVKAIDKAAAKGLLHRNNAANKKSAMTIKLNKLA